MEIRTFRRDGGVDDTESVVALWEACGLVRPWNDPRADIERKLDHSPELFLVGVADEAVVASVMAGYDGHRGWVYYLAVTPSLQGQGLGRALLDEAEARLVSLGCPKLNLQVRDDNEAARGFYEAIGYAQDRVQSYGRRLIDDT